MKKAIVSIFAVLLIFYAQNSVCQSDISFDTKLYLGHNVVSLNSDILIISDTNSTNQFSTKVDLTNYNEEQFCCPDVYTHYSNGEYKAMPNEEEEEGYSFFLIKEGNLTSTKPFISEEFDLSAGDVILTDKNLLLAILINQNFITILPMTSFYLFLNHQ